MNSALLVLVLSLGAPALKEKPRPTTIVGEWVAEHLTVGGRDAPPKTEIRWVFSADGERSIINNGQRYVQGRYTTDPKALPATLDLDPDKGPANSYACIYKIDGDTLTLNLGWQMAERPSSFKSPAGSKCTLYVFRRVKTSD